jgi:putative spermidine/putrescine transport system substrate-binding protein
MNEFSRRQALAGLGAPAAGGVFGLPARAADGTLVVPTLGGAWEQFWRDTITPAFAEERGETVTLDVGNGRVRCANHRAAGFDEPPYSIVTTNEVFASGLRREGLFETLDLTQLRRSRCTPFTFERPCPGPTQRQDLP